MLRSLFLQVNSGPYNGDILSTGWVDLEDTAVQETVNGDVTTVMDT